MKVTLCMYMYVEATAQFNVQPEIAGSNPAQGSSAFFSCLP